MAEISTTFAIEDFGNKWILKLNEFRKNKLYCDVTLKTKDKEIECHKVVLIACGGVFESSLTEGRNLKNNVTELSFDCASEALEAIINFAYEGTMTMTSQNLLLCLKASLELKLEEIKIACINVIEEKVLKLFSTKEELFCDLVDFLKSNTSNGSLCGCDDVKKIEDSVSARISKEHPELSSTYDTCHAFLTCAGLKIPSEKEDVSKREKNPFEEEEEGEKNPFGEEEEEEKEEKQVEESGGNPFGDEEEDKIDKKKEEDEVVIETPKPSSTDSDVKSSESSSQAAVPEVVVVESSNPFGDEEEADEIFEVKKEEEQSNPFGDEEEDEVKPMTPVPKTRNSSSLEAPKPLARRGTSPTPTRRKAPPPPPASPSLRERSATTSSKKPPPRPKPPSVKQEKVESSSSSFARSFGKTLRKSLRISKKTKKKSLENPQKEFVSGK